MFKHNFWNEQSNNDFVPPVEPSYNRPMNEIVKKSWKSMILQSLNSFINKSCFAKEI
jgi:hypothetical protein